jgi:ACT domain-containing protein
MNMDNKNAFQATSAIYNVLQTIPVHGEQNITSMMGIFQALKEIMQWMNTLEDSEVNNVPR